MNPCQSRRARQPICDRVILVAALKALIEALGDIGMALAERLAFGLRRCGKREKRRVVLIGCDVDENASLARDRFVAAPIEIVDFAIRFGPGQVEYLLRATAGNRHPPRVLLEHLVEGPALRFHGHDARPRQRLHQNRIRPEIQQPIDQAIQEFGSEVVLEARQVRRSEDKQARTLGLAAIVSE